MMTFIKSRHWFDLKSAAKYLGVSEAVIRLAIERNQMRYTRLAAKGRSSFRFHRSWLDMYLFEHTDKVSWFMSVRIRIASWMLPEDSAKH
ncbi:MAG: hypothetical protein AUJ47_09400 [Candidatus Marinimicrobia bacterium CG1_02_48_14]|nr:MAG: hypothetical protein AUJ47_09400 [Candidatus Marinimicrobia bacterium CG1_02_48_14]PJA54061.1 MAG: hypothetical protein CO167_05920 [Candidatus Marinimicrobia bacterium CG_4_9_14_3_um_filter_48_9]